MHRKGKPLKRTQKIKIKSCNKEFWGRPNVKIEDAQKGFKSFRKELTATLNSSKIQNMIEKREQTRKFLDLKFWNQKLINKKYSNKILGSGELKKKIEITANFASKQALEKWENWWKINIIKK